MKRIFVPAALTVLTALASLAWAADLQSELFANEKSFYTTKDAAALGKLLTEDSVQIRAKNVLTGREAIVADAVADSCKTSNLEFRDAKMKRLTDDVVVLLFTTVYDQN